jgi:hypothetical protein
VAQLSTLGGITHHTEITIMKNRIVGLLLASLLALIFAGCATSHPVQATGWITKYDIKEADDMRPGLPAYFGLPSSRIQVEPGSGVVYITVFGVSSSSDRQAIADKVLKIQERNPKMNLIKLKFEK